MASYYRPSRRGRAPQKPVMSGYREDMPESVIDLFATDFTPGPEVPLCARGALAGTNGICFSCAKRSAKGKR